MLKFLDDTKILFHLWQSYIYNNVNTIEDMHKNLNNNNKIKCIFLKNPNYSDTVHNNIYNDRRSYYIIFTMIYKIMIRLSY